ncbi:MOSC domain-containing protein [Ginsengibacter hankyongi]|uniref:MOSC domain-containing protein n=1 Tax=Ginsengibacter hankyongi TaxID=2607284 RepID=A0A5J5IEV7_9BACT|nr:MOSC N-terminal beta barrel domain-containing protein [Ginsengibacter hankyongi]KAA9034516.1 MOSC domain-containing protein [Ginsengibacter hankyongi]
MLTVSDLFIYPIKSLGGISVSSAKVTSRGFEYDRRWMLVDSANRFITQRELPSMALLQVALSTGGLKVYHKKNKESQIIIPFIPESEQHVTVQIFDDACEAVFVSDVVDEWFTEMLSIRCRLVYMPESSLRMVDTEYGRNNEITGFADAFPFLMIGQSSLDDLNAKLIDPLPINRFRPNIVFTGGTPYIEDVMEEFIINNVIFFGVKLCARCNIPTINQDNASKSNEPSKTFASYRQRNNKVYFGQNLLANGVGAVNVGDKIENIKMHTTDSFRYFQND